MKRKILLIFVYIFVISATSFAKESQDELKKYLSEMNSIVIEVQEAMRNMSMKFLTPKTAMQQIISAIEKFEPIKPPSIFSKSHYSMLSAFKSIRDGLKLFAEGEREGSVELVRKGAALLRKAAINIKTTAQDEGLIPAKPSLTKPILPPQTPSVTAGPSPTISPHIASPDIRGDSMTATTGASSDIDLKDIPYTSVNILETKDSDNLKDDLKKEPTQ